MRAHVATCVAIGERGVLIEGAPGSGKSSLALALIDRGARLVGDDGILLEAAGGRLMAQPHPRTRGLIEIRNLGLASYAVCESVPIALLITLSESAPRFIEAAQLVEREGVALPAVAIWPEPCAPALKVEHALRLYGSAC
jgi:serine kinase of HPr protein (carbohydrate metabolism regulator)